MSPELYESTGTTLKWLLAIAWLLPLLGFVVEIFGGYWSDRKSKTAAWMAIGCIGTGFVCSVIAALVWANASDFQLFRLFNEVDSHAVAHDDHAAEAEHEHAAEEHAEGAAGDEVAEAEQADAAHAEHHDEANDPYAHAYAGTFYQLMRFDALEINISYYIDGLTIVMFCMVTLIATCIHIFAVGYMGDELTESYEDHEVHLPGHHGHFHRPGRFYRFFAFLSLFCFSMLGLVLAGNIFQVFIFWELVGVCSYFLIGFYVERKTASNAANKAFIMNRVGDFGFIVGLMILWTTFGTFTFANPQPGEGESIGLFQMLRDEEGNIDTDEARSTVYLQGSGGERMEAESGAERSIPYFLLIAAGIGIFAGCIGKSAQFPLQTWLPDAMEGPTPVSALVHSATMVAAGVYLAGRFYPMFLPEVLLVIAYVGCFTLFIGATIAVVALDIKKVLAYSTISQLGYMMLAIGVGGWAAGLLHLITHAFFKSLLFLCSGSVIHGCHHVQTMDRMGGLRRKMPITAYTMLIGVIAICGLAIPYPKVMGETLAFSGYHSKDAIVSVSLAYMAGNPAHMMLFIIPLLTAGITAFYMFRLWFMTFAGEPRDREIYDHAHESPSIMTVPLIILAFFAIFVAIGGETQRSTLYAMLTSSEPASVARGMVDTGQLALNFPSYAEIHEYHTAAGAVALLVALAGALMAFLFYGLGVVDPAAIRKQSSGLYRFLVDKWKFDELYDTAFVRPTHAIGRWCTVFDRTVLDRTLHGLANGTVGASRWDRKFDESVVDGAVRWVGDATYSIGNSLRYMQTGRLRQYIMFIAFGVVSLFVLLVVFFPV